MRGLGVGGQEDPVVGSGGCERRIEVIVKMQKKIGGRVRGSGLGGQGGCERRSEVIVKIQKHQGLGGSGWGSGWM